MERDRLRDRTPRRSAAPLRPALPDGVFRGGRRAAPRILITRLSAIGDTVLTLPVLCALRNHFPRAWIGWVAEAPAAPMLEGHECLDELIVLRRGWLKSPVEVGRLRRRLRQLDIDVAIDPQSMTKSAVAARLSGAKLRIGLRGRHGRELSPWLNNRLVENTKPHIVDRSLELLAPLGVESPAVEFRTPVDAEAEAAVAEYVRGVARSGRFAVINPGASWDSKLWVMERYAEVARRLAGRCDLPATVIWAGGRERAWAEQVVARSGGAARLAPATSLVQLTALLRAARLFVGSDTGPLHIAAAAGASCVGLYGVTRPEDCGPYGPPHIALQQQYEGGTSRQRRAAANNAMRRITVEQVCRACDQLLDRRGEVPPAKRPCEIGRPRAPSPAASGRLVGGPRGASDPARSRS